MPSADIFRKLGLFVVDRFVDAEACQQIRTGMQAAATEAATVRAAGGSFAVDESVRSVKWVRVAAEVADALQRRLLDRKVEVEAHFSVSLRDCQRPQFLAYGQGDFYHAHRDSAVDREAPAVSQERRISVVVFFNAASPEPEPNHYGGGALTFYGLIDDPRMEGVGLPLEAEEGLLIAFPADTVHAVAPVTHGVRYTAVSWYR
jgi:predicted 2-oxoglutarate/Fe(II)-dependent dioxygenase YbiX